MSKALKLRSLPLVLLFLFINTGCDSKPTIWNMRADLEVGEWRYDPEGLLMMLRRRNWFSGSGGPWELVLDIPVNGVTNWINVEDVKTLSKYKDDLRPCAGITTKFTSPLCSRRYSTVRREAAFIILGYFDGEFPPHLRSSGLSEDQIASAFRQAEAVSR